ncbi:hypothetical protein EMIT051CA3_21095 [Pseudomonas chlororaphis]
MLRSSRYSGSAQGACSRCRRLRSSGTLAAILLAPETLRVYRRLRQRLQGCGDFLDIPALLNACSRCRRLRSSGTLAAILLAPETLRVYRRLRQRLQGRAGRLSVAVAGQVAGHYPHPYLLQVGVEGDLAYLAQAGAGIKALGANVALEHVQPQAGFTGIGGALQHMLKQAATVPLAGLGLEQIDLLQLGTGNAAARGGPCPVEFGETYGLLLLVQGQQPQMLALGGKRVLQAAEREVLVEKLLYAFSAPDRGEMLAVGGASDGLEGIDIAAVSFTDGDHASLLDGIGGSGRVRQLSLCAGEAPVLRCHWRMGSRARWRCAVVVVSAPFIRRLARSAGPFRS